VRSHRKSRRAAPDIYPADKRYKTVVGGLLTKCSTHGAAATFKRLVEGVIAYLDSPTLRALFDGLNKHPSIEDFRQTIAASESELDTNTDGSDPLECFETAWLQLGLMRSILSIGSVTKELISTKWIELAPCAESFNCELQEALDTLKREMRELYCMADNRPASHINRDREIWLLKNRIPALTWGQLGIKFSITPGAALLAYKRQAQREKTGFRRLQLARSECLLYQFLIERSELVFDAVVDSNAEAKLNGSFQFTSVPILPKTWYAALFTMASTDDRGTFLREVSGSGYARVAVTNNETNFPARSVGNPVVTKGLGASIDWGTACGSWGTIVAVGFLDDSSGGNLGFWGPLSASKTVDDGDRFKIHAQGAEPDPVEAAAHI
jgi:hypothetical protein